MWQMHDGMTWWMIIGPLWFLVFWDAIVSTQGWTCDASRHPAETCHDDGVVP